MRLDSSWVENRVLDVGSLKVVRFRVEASKGSLSWSALHFGLFDIPTYPRPSLTGRTG